MKEINQYEKLTIHDSSGTVIGIISPSTFYHIKDNSTHISGPRKSIKTNEQSIEALIEGLKQAGSLIEGNSKETAELAELFNAPETSRTTSYLTTFSSSCREIITIMHALKAAHILIIGCGGIGSSTALLLAGAGIKKFTLADDDIIEKSNLNRQLFWRLQDVGKKKTETLKNAITERFEATEISCINQQLEYEKILELVINNNFNTVIITADSPIDLATRCGELSRAAKTTVMSAGYLHSSCRVNFFSASDYDSEYEISPDANQWRRLPESIAPSYGPNNFILASILAHNTITNTILKDSPNIKSNYTQWNTRSFPISFSTFIWP
ncbi:ThiF family adenylyltransferase [Pseudomonas sp. R3-56]|uniref:ThiF family adenylyltransferase n=1 Tax=Pseudomonas sp. R3-56 TaxID=2817401 RepID=UPI003DA80AF5